MKFVGFAHCVVAAALALVAGASPVAPHDVEAMLETRSLEEVRRSSDDYLKYTLKRHLPGLDFKIPRSYGGYVSVNATNMSDDRQLYFFYTPTDSDAGDDDVIIWINGGPGCSSMEGLWQENGPVIFPYYSANTSVKPYLNPYSTHKVAHAIWIDQPGNTGFSKAGLNIQGFGGLAEDFGGFLVNFFKEFKYLQGKRLWLTGESFAGAMIPNIAHHIYENSKYFESHGINLKGIQINDPSWADDTYMEQLPAYEFAKHYQKSLTITDAEMTKVAREIKKWGLTTFVEDNLKYPPTGPIKAPSGWNSSVYDVWGTLLSYWNGAHCSSVYDVTSTCPSPVDPLGYPLNAVSPSATNIFNNITGFKAAIGADPSRTWLECTDNNWVDLGEALPQANVMPSVIERSERVVIGGGDRDVLLITNGSRLAIQNMTWSGHQGFQTKPSGVLKTAAGQRGTYHHERGLTFIEYFYAGHMVPQDDHAAGFKTTKYLVGQIKKLSNPSNTS